jgi:hypothetical protein
MKVLKSKAELFLRRLLEASSYASQIVGSFIEIPIVQIVFLLEYRRRHHHKHIYRQRAVGLDHCSKSVATNDVDIRWSCIRQLVRSGFVRLRVWKRDSNTVRFVQPLGGVRNLLKRLSVSSHRTMRCISLQREPPVLQCLRSAPSIYAKPRSRH